jgi:hypothetical protein
MASMDVWDSVLCDFSTNLYFKDLLFLNYSVGHSSAAFMPHKKQVKEKSFFFR